MTPLDGNGLLGDAGRLHEALRSALAPGGSITLDLSDLGAIDISFVQLMVSAALMAERTGHALAIANVSPALRADFERAGIAIDPASGLILPN